MPITILQISIGSNHSTMETIMTSTIIYTPITPTYLYIKQHSVTGLKYFGKTTKSNPYKYLGSGKHWLRHIKKHGIQFVETIWLSEPYTNKELLTEFALFISEEYNIVESKEWANLIPENGINGGDNPASKTKASIEKRTLKTAKQFSFLKEGMLITGTNLNQFCKLHNLNQAAMQGVLSGRLYKHKNYTSSDTKHIKYWEEESPKRKKECGRKQSEASKGKPKSESHKQNMKCHNNNKIQVECPHCNKVGQLATMKGNHIPYCNLNTNKKEKPLVTCKTCGHTAIVSPNFYRYHNDNCRCHDQSER
jgi:hypothetical protein